MRIFSLFVAAFIISAAPSFAQETEDVIFLKNGSVIRGQIVEMIPDSLIKIGTRDGNILVFKMAEIARMTKENRTLSRQDEISGAPSVTEGLGSHFTLSGGLAIPVGEFASATDGGAKMGYTGAAEYELRVSEHVGWVLQFNFTYNPIDEEAMRSSLGMPSSLSVSTTPWIIYAPESGVKFTFAASPAFSVYFIGALGAAFGKSPELTVSGPGGSIKQNSGTGTAFLFSFSAGFVFGNSFRVGARYMSAKPEYETTVSGVAGGTTVSGSGKFEQKTAIVQIMAGIEF
jgi:hypothetical protein